jgi:hypothetical protein
MGEDPPLPGDDYRSHGLRKGPIVPFPDPYMDIGMLHSLKRSSRDMQDGGSGYDERMSMGRYSSRFSYRAIGTGCKVHSYHDSTRFVEEPESNYIRSIAVIEDIRSIFDIRVFGSTHIPCN